ncbi:MAG TPA: DNA-3-methyladenine glycosylase [Opitutales bacterium]|nr:DNA-3-methyladenine glycosylase [Opitutales bacterium]
MEKDRIESHWAEPARAVAPLLLGRWLCRRERNGKITRARITETEAYCGPRDRASHAARGITPRNRVMFGPPGFWYVYLCYGVHWMLNLVTGPEGYPSAVLLRGVEGATGPGRLTRALQITKAFDGRPCARSADLWVEGPAEIPPDLHMRRGPRIGVDYAGPHWAGRHYRWWLEQKFDKKRMQS